MRLLRLAVLIALLFSNAGSLVPGAHATEEVKFKGRGKNPPPSQQYRDKPSQPEQPPSRPPDKQHPEKRPDDPGPREKRPADPRPEQPQRPYVPEPPCPPPTFDPLPPVGYCDPVPMPFPDPPIVIYPVPGTLESALSRRMRTLNIEGFVGQVVVGWDGQVHFERSYGDGGRYDIAAVTRAFTAWAVCLLVDANTLEFATTLGELFPGIPPDKRHITIEQLLANTSGLRSTYAADGEADRDVAVGKLLAQPLAHASGKEFTHSDDGYVILAAAIEVASGMTYESFMLEAEIVSREMTSTIFWGEGEEEDASWGRRGSGGIQSTAHDLYRWATRFTEQPVDLVDQIVRPREWTEDSVGIGYGWFSTDSNQPILWTSGTGDFDHNVMVVVYPNNTILVVTSDRYHGDVPWSERVANTLEPFLRVWTRDDPDPRWYRADVR